MVQDDMQTRTDALHQRAAKEVTLSSESFKLPLHVKHTHACMHLHSSTNSSVATLPLFGDDVFSLRWCHVAYAILELAV